MKHAHQALVSCALLASTLLVPCMSRSVETEPMGTQHPRSAPQEEGWKPVAEYEIPEATVSREPRTAPDGAGAVGIFLQEAGIEATMIVAVLDGPQVGVFLGWSQPEGLGTDVWRVAFTLEDGSSIFRDAGGSGPHALMFTSGWPGGGTDVASIRKVTLYFDAESE